MNPFLWFLPAYVANASATFSRILPFRHPIDFGISIDNRLLGDGKTFEGFFIGLVMGSSTGILLNLFGVPTPFFYLVLGALVGDLIGSYIKRRTGLPRGEDAFPLDQLDFVFGAFLLTPPDANTALVIILATPLLHRFANILGFILKLKKEPW